MEMKGFAFTLDVAIGIGIVFIILIASYTYYSESKNIGSVDISLTRLSSDAVITLDYKGILDTLNKNYIESELNRILPENINMSMIIYTYDESGLVKTTEINDDIKENYISGKWIFSTKNEKRYYNIVVYKAGFK